MRLAPAHMSSLALQEEGRKPGKGARCAGLFEQNAADQGGASDKAFCESDTSKYVQKRVLAKQFSWTYTPEDPASLEPTLTPPPPPPPPPPPYPPPPGPDAAIGGGNGGNSSVKFRNGGSNEEAPTASGATRGAAKRLGTVLAGGLTVMLLCFEAA